MTDVPHTGLRYDFAALGPAHKLVIGQVPEGSEVLELGCATGYMTRALAERGCRVTVVDIDAAALERAAAHAAKVMHLDLDREPLPAALEADVVVCADVLEHLRDPEAALRALQKVLKPDGRVVVSLPNIAFWRIRLGLLRGRFDYQEAGILDRTHLHFYTRDSVSSLAGSAGYDVELIQGITESFPGAWLLRTPLRPLKFKVDGLMSRLFPRLFAYQWVLVLRPHGTSPVR